jgi:hypothetical protein
MIPTLVDSKEYPAELFLENLIVDATALFEQYEPGNDDEPTGPEDTCENLYTMPP